MYPDSVSFRLWRQSADSAAGLRGCFPASADLRMVRSSLKRTSLRPVRAISKRFPVRSLAVQPTTSPVEFRIYGWNSGTSANNSTHIVAASMRARFASVAGTPINPTGRLTVHGDFYHLDGGTIAVDLAGTSAGVNYDTIDVTGNVELEGDLIVSLADVNGSPFGTTLSNTFDILTADQITGEFQNVSLPSLSWQYNWRLDYLADAVRLVVVATGDFNDDGVVDAADFIVWRKFGGTPRYCFIWQTNFGSTAVVGSAQHVDSFTGESVPEPASRLMLIVAIGVGIWQRRSIASAVPSTR